MAGKYDKVIGYRENGCPYIKGAMNVFEFSYFLGIYLKWCRKNKVQPDKKITERSKEYGMAALFEDRFSRK